MISQNRQAIAQLPEPLPPDPLPLVESWLREAVEGRVQPNPNAMTIATAAADGSPAVRVVLLKSLVPDPGYFVFYTNYRSRKAREIAANNRIAACLHWDTLGRQVRFEGLAVASPPAESDAYFASRDWQSRVAAWASDQSEPLASREALETQLRQRAAALGLPLDADWALQPDPGERIPRPPHWGGYRVWLHAVEMWTLAAARLHDRARWERHLQPTAGDGFRASAWSAIRLQP